MDSRVGKFATSPKYYWKMSLTEYFFELLIIFSRIFYRIGLAAFYYFAGRSFWNLDLIRYLLVPTRKAQRTGLIWQGII